MTQQEYERFLALRDALHAEIRACLELDDHCKSYEGTFSLIFPNVFDPDYWGIHLDCYVVGPNRHYDWTGETFASALEKCEVDVFGWINESAKWRAEEATTDHPAEGQSHE